jgi:hypothetical protein
LRAVRGSKRLSGKEKTGLSPGRGRTRRNDKKKNGGAFAPPPSHKGLHQTDLAEQLEHRLVCLVGDRQRRDFQLLLGLLGEQVRAFHVLVGDDEVGGVSKLDRVEMVDALVPNVSAWLCTLKSAVLMFATMLESWPSDWKDVAPEPLAADRPRPAELKVTPVMVSALVPVGLKLIVRLSPESRLTPL